LKKKHIFLVKGDWQKESQVNHHMEVLALVERSFQMGFQVDRATQDFWFWLKGMGEKNPSLS
jgi:hypothetical protein